MLLLKVPIPVPSLVLVVKAIVGLRAVLQHTPRAETVEPFAVDILPPLLAVVVVILEETVVVNNATLPKVVKESCAP